jgi:hypothetical protein
MDNLNECKYPAWEMPHNSKELDDVIMQMMLEKWLKKYINNPFKKEDKEDDKISKII